MSLVGYYFRSTETDVVVRGQGSTGWGFVQIDCAARSRTENEAPKLWS
jgi:hypothetical protein